MTNNWSYIDSCYCCVYQWCFLISSFGRDGGMVDFCHDYLWSNSFIHSFSVIKYAKSNKVAVTVRLFNVSNAYERLLGMVGSRFFFTYAGGNGESTSGCYPRNDSKSGLAALFLAGIFSSLLAAIIPIWINDWIQGWSVFHGWLLLSQQKRQRRMRMSSRWYWYCSSKAMIYELSYLYLLFKYYCNHVVCNDCHNWNVKYMGLILKLNKTVWCIFVGPLGHRRFYFFYFFIELV